MPPTREDTLLDQLPEAARVATRAALAVPVEDWSGAQKPIAEALDAVGWPTRPAAIPLADELTPAQRALAELLAHRPGTDVPGTYAIPMSSWNRRRWLGIDPPSVLEREHAHEGERGPLWRLALGRQKDAAAMVALLETLPLPDRFEAFRDLRFRAYGCYLSGDDEIAYAMCAGELGAGVATWAPRLADELLAMWSGGVTERGGLRMLVRSLCMPAFLALVRANVRLEPRWDVLLPLGLGRWHAWTLECLRALPEQRRDAALAAAFERELDGAAVAFGVELLEVHASPWLVGQILDQAGMDDRMTEAEILAALAPHAARDADLAKLLGERAARPRLTLRVDEVLRPRTDSELPEHLQAQLAAVAPAAARLTPDTRLTIVELTETGAGRGYTVFLHHVDAGVVVQRGTIKIVARIVQFGMECADPALAEGLNAALRDLLRAGAP